jgi:hypothetical protein
MVLTGDIDWFAFFNILILDFDVDNSKFDDESRK